MKVRATLVELFNRVVKVNQSDKDKIYINGENNLYPNEIERVIKNSPTASRASALMANYIDGKGVQNSVGELIPYDELPLINEKKRYKVTDVNSLIAKDLATQNGSFIHVIYGLDDDGNVKPKFIDVLNYTKCRKSKEDDEDNEGKIYYYDFEESNGFFGKTKEKKWFYPFNPNPEVVLSQIKNDWKKKADEEFDITEAIKHYRGQVFYLNLNSDQVYATSLFDSVFNDCDSEYRISLYTNTEVRTGFLGKTIFLTQGLDEEQDEQVKQDLSTFMGAENSAQMYHLSIEQTDNLDNVLKTIQLKPQFDEKLFEVTKKDIRKNILGAANNAPEILVLSGDGTLFGTNSEAYKEAKIFYSEQNEYAREQIERMWSFLGFESLPGVPVKIKPIAERDGLPE